MFSFYSSIAHVAGQGKHLRPDKTHTLFQRNILQHCCAQRVTRVWPPCRNMLQDVGWRWIKFKNDQIFVATFFGCCKLLRAFVQLLHNISQHDPTMLQDVALECCVRLAFPVSVLILNPKKLPQPIRTKVNITRSQ